MYKLSLDRWAEKFGGRHVYM